MGKTTKVLLLLLFGFQGYAQTDNNGNPVLYSISTGEKDFKNCLLISNYYTLQNNIDNKLSSVFISESPSLDEISKAAIDLPSDFFILTKENKAIAMILLQKPPKKEFMLIIMNSNKQEFHECKLDGDITENRANELISLNLDSTAVIHEGILTFNNEELNIITSRSIEEAVFRLLIENKLYKRTPSKMIVLSNNQIKEIILKESNSGGKFDFFTEIKGKEFEAVQVKSGVFTTNLGMALYRWGGACFDVGVNKVEDAYEIFAEHKGRALNQREKEYIKMRFYKNLER